MAYGDQVESTGAGTNTSTYGYSAKLMPWLRAQGGRFDRVGRSRRMAISKLCPWRRYAGSPIPYYVFPHGMLDPWFQAHLPVQTPKKWLYWPWAEYRVLRDARRCFLPPNWSDN